MWHIYAIYATYCANTAYFLHSVHLCIFQHLMRNLEYAVCLLSDSDSDDEPVNPALDDDDQAPGVDFQPEAGAGPGPEALPPPAPAPRRPADMRKTMQAAGGPNLENVIRAIDTDMGPNPDPIPSERCGGELRRASLKRKASRISRCAAEVFAFITSKTSSIEEAADVLESFGNVSFCALVLFAYTAYKRILYNLLHILHIFNI